ncbi:hypothetical protein KKA00_11595 [bacterium]|nr:hypothetical protein [bacterium]
MKLKLNRSTIGALLIAGLFGLFLVYGALFGSDFPRGMYSSPMNYDATDWDVYQDLNGNVVWNGKGAWHRDSSTTLYDYLEILADYDQMSILDKGNWYYGYTDDDSIPYWVKYYGNGQQNRLQAEFNRTNALATLADTGNGEGYYYFLHDPGASVSDQYPGGDERSLRCKKDSCQNSFTGKPGVFIWGVKDSKYDTWLDEPRFDVGMNAQNQGIYGYFQHGRNIVVRPRVAIYDTLGVASSDTVLKFSLSVRDTSGNFTPHSIYYTKGMFPDNYRFINDDTLEAFLPPDYSWAVYEFATTNKCDVLVDYVEYMDKEQAYPLVDERRPHHFTLASNP